MGDEQIVSARLLPDDSPLVKSADGSKRALAEAAVAGIVPDEEEVEEAQETVGVEA